jgi:uncharacterized protein YbjT (DUF2867 family)
MTTTVVTGATGRLGRPTVQRLRAAGHEVRALSRRSGPGLVTADLLTGAGVGAALAGADVVVHLATGRDDAALARTLVGAAATAGVRHLVVVSIVGIEDIPLGYYRQKLAVEQVVRESGVPATVLRATQFHSLVEALLTVQRFSPVVLAPTFRLQPIAVEDVADRLVELVGSAPAGRVPDIGGPEQRTVRDLAGAWARATGTRRPVVPLTLPGRLFGAYAAGRALVPGPPYGRRTFDEHLAGRAGADR